jgi:hypothetical protein
MPRDMLMSQKGNARDAEAKGSRSQRRIDLTAILCSGNSCSVFAHPATLSDHSQRHADKRALRRIVYDFQGYELASVRDAICFASSDNLYVLPERSSGAFFAIFK